MEAIKMSLCDIFLPHINWYNYTEELTPEAFIQKQQEMTQAASEYVASLKVCHSWSDAVNSDVENLYNSHAHTFSTAKQQSYKNAIEAFLIEVRKALFSHGYKYELKELHPLTLYRLGIKAPGTELHEGLSRSEAKKVYWQLKRQGFRSRAMWQELWLSDQWTVFGYKEPLKDGACKNSTGTLQNDAGGQLQGNDHNKPLEAKEMPQQAAQATNIEELKEYLQFSFYNKPGGKNGETSEDFNSLLKDIEQARKSKGKKFKLVTIALAIYEGGMMKPSKKGNVFSDWYRKFCEIVGCEVSSYKPNDVTNNDENYLDKFPYLIKKQTGFR